MTASRVALVWDERIAAYDFGPAHPLKPVRVELTTALIRDTGLIDGNAVVAGGAEGEGRARARTAQEVIEVLPGDFSEEEVLRLHRPDYVDAVKRVSADPSIHADWHHGLGPGDNPVFAGMHAASLRVCAASKEAAQQVWTGASDHAFNPAGGLHHAMPDRASGFCVYNDPAVAIDWLLEHGAERVCYVDVDVHHGDGVEAIFAADPRVLTISLHESGRFLFPGTGATDDTGAPGAEGSAVNLPLHPGTAGALWLDAFDEVVEPLVRAFDADVLVTQLGCDTHTSDPLAHLSLTVDDYVGVYARLHALAHEACDGRWVALGGGGYQLVQVVPRAWTLAFAEMTGRPLPVETPRSWRELAEQRTGERAPTGFTDDPVRVSAPIREQTRRAAEEAVDVLRRTVLVQHGVR